MFGGRNNLNANTHLRSGGTEIATLAETTKLIEIKNKMRELKRAIADTDANLRPNYASASDWIEFIMSDLTSAIDELFPAETAPQLLDLPQFYFAALYARSHPIHLPANRSDNDESTYLNDDPSYGARASRKVGLGDGSAKGVAPLKSGGFIQRMDHNSSVSEISEAPEEESDEEDFEDEDKRGTINMSHRERLLRGMQKAGKLGAMIQKKYTIEELLTYHVSHPTQFFFLLVDNPGGGITTRLLQWLRSYGESLVETNDSSDSDSDSDSDDESSRTNSSGSSVTTESSEEDDEWDPTSKNSIFKQMSQGGKGAVGSAKRLKAMAEGDEDEDEEDSEDGSDSDSSLSSDERETRRRRRARRKRRAKRERRRLREAGHQPLAEIGVTKALVEKKNGRLVMILHIDMGQTVTLFHWDPMYLVHHILEELHRTFGVGTMVPPRDRNVFKHFYKWLEVLQQEQYGDLILIIDGVEELDLMRVEGGGG